MLRLTKLFCAGALLTGCIAGSSTLDRGVEVTQEGCTKIEGSELGTDITIQVPDGSGGFVAVTFSDWVSKDGESNELIGFTLSADSEFTVKAGQDEFTGSGTVFLHPNGTGGPTVNGISNIVVCVATPPPDCDLNDDGDTTDEGECDYVPTPDCDLNDDGDTTDEGECDYVPPPDCDKNDDGDTTDEGECDHVPPPDCDKNDDGDTTDEGECNHVPC